MTRWRRLASVTIPLLAVLAIQLYWLERRERFTREAESTLTRLTDALRAGGLQEASAAPIAGASRQLVTQMDALVTDALYACVLGIAFPLVLGIALLTNRRGRLGNRE